MSNRAPSSSVLDKYPVLENARIYLTPLGSSIRNTERPFSRHPLELNEDAHNILLKMDGSKSLKDIVFELADSNDNAKKSMHLVEDFALNLSKYITISFSEFPIKHNLTIIGSKRAFLPVHVSVELTNACNLKCNYCYNYSNPRNNKYLSNPISFFESLRKSGVCSLELTGGEPLLHRKIKDIIRYCCTHYDLVALLTNGTLLDEELLQIFSKHKDTLYVQTDLDATDPTLMTKICGKNILTTLFHNIAQIANTGVLLRVGMVLHYPEQIDEVEKVMQKARELGAFQFICSPAAQIGRARSGKSVWTIELHNKFEKIHNKLKKQYPDFYSPDPHGFLEQAYQAKNCGAGHRTVTIGPDKLIRPCMMLPSNVGILGNCGLIPFSESMDQHTLEYFAKMSAPSPEDCKDCQFIPYCFNCFSRALDQAIQIGYGNCNWLNLPQQEILRAFINYNKTKGPSDYANS